MARGRVRGLHTHQRAVDSLGAGARCALNVAGTELGRADVSRGDWLAAPEIAVNTRQLDLRLLPARGAVLKDGARIHFCHGAASVTGRLVLLSRSQPPRFAQIVLDQPVHALARDACILRHADDRQTLAGGIVLDPFPPARGRRRPERAAMLAALDQPTAAAALAQVLPLAAEGIDLERFAQAWNLRPQDAAALWQAAALIAVGGRGFDPERWRQARAALLAAVTQFHAAQPDSYGPAAAQLLRADPVSGGRLLQRARLDSLIQDRELLREGAQLRLPTHSIELSLSEKVLWRSIAPLLGPDRRPMTMHDIARLQRLEPRTVKRVLERAGRAGLVVRIADGRYLHRRAVLDLAAMAEALAARADAGQFDAAAFRDQSNLGRGISIELLEYFDRIGFTQRVGDQRRVARPAAAVLEADVL